VRNQMKENGKKKWRVRSQAMVMSDQIKVKL
jgi:hypothetical protein